MKSTIIERDWKVLLDNLERGNCVALVGPDLFTGRADGGRRHLVTELSHRLAEMLESEEGVRVDDPDNLPLVAQIFEDRKRNRSDLVSEVTSFYGDVGIELASGPPKDATFENLAALPFQLFVTMRHDPTLQRYLAASGKKPIEKSYDFRGGQQRTIGNLGTVDQPLVYQLLGETANPGSMALTESDLLDLLEAIASGDPALPADLRNQFKEKSFLFLGCGLQKYYLRVLLHVLGLSRSGQRSFALETTAPTENQESSPRSLAESVWFYEVGYRTLKFLDLEEEKFLGDLRNLWEEKHPDAGFRPTGTTERGESADRPKAFVSYVKEDKEFAEQLVSELEGNGIETWIDVQGLRRGDNWERALQDAIKEVDFFIVLLSRHIRDGVISYVHREVDEALKWQSMRGAVKFIYPVQIDEEAGRLDALDRENIQASDLKKEGVVDLAKDIKREFGKLQRR